MSRWLPALRIARRTVLRNPGRSLLVALLIGLPVAGATTLDVLVQTMSSSEHRVGRQIGAADLVLTGRSAAQVTAVAPPGTRVVATPLTYTAFLERAGRATRTRLVAADVREPLHRHEARLVEGRAARGPGEVLVTRTLAARLRLLDDAGHLRPAGSIRLRRGPAAAVVGLARAPFCLDCSAVIAAPGSELTSVVQRRGPGDGGYVEGLATRPAPIRRPVLVDLPAGVTVPEFEALVAGPGVHVLSRDDVANPPQMCCVDSHETLRAAALVAVLVGLGLLEIVLLAGTAFAVGARRQLRELGLVAASGGSPRDVRRVVLAQGLALGLLGTIGGVVTGAVVALAGRSLWEGMYNEELIGWTLASWELAGIALLGLLSGLAAAAAPAIGAGRLRPIDALAGRVREARPRRRRNARIGAVLLAGGVVLGIAGDRVFSAALSREVVDRGDGHQLWSDGGVALVVVGGTAAVVGLVLLAPALIGALARFGGRLPLSARLAVRDAERHRHRTGPATGAITVAVTGAVVTAFVVAMVFRADEQGYVPMLPAHTMAITTENPKVPRRTLVAAADAAAAELPGGRRHVVRRAAGGRAGPRLRLPVIDCPPAPERMPTCTAPLGGPWLAVVDPESSAGAAAAGGPLDPAARDALAAGKIVVFEPGLLDRAGNVRIELGSRSERLAGYVARDDRQYGQLPSGLASSSFAAARGWPTTLGQVLVTFSSRATDADVDSAIAAAAGDRRLAVYVDTGDDIGRDTILLIVALVAALVTLFGVAISVALSAAEGRADLATLAAVGAPHRRRRALVAYQALLVGGLGGLLGVALGTFFAYTMRATTGSSEFVVPWWNLLAAGLGAPLVAALVAAVCARGRLPLARRAD